MFVLPYKEILGQNTQWVKVEMISPRLNNTTKTYGEEFAQVCMVLCNYSEMSQDRVELAIYLDISNVSAGDIFTRREREIE